MFVKSKALEYELITLWSKGRSCEKEKFAIQREAFYKDFDNNYAQHLAVVGNNIQFKLHLSDCIYFWPRDEQLVLNEENQVDDLDKVCDAKQEVNLFHDLTDIELEDIAEASIGRANDYMKEINSEMNDIGMTIASSDSYKNSIDGIAQYARYIDEYLTRACKFLTAAHIRAKKGD